MPFMFRGQDLTAKLGDPLNAPDSLYAYISSSQRGIVDELREHWHGHRRDRSATEYASVDSAFGGLEGWWKRSYDDDSIMTALYADENVSQGVRAIAGADSAEAFMTRFNDARANSFHAFIQGLSIQTLVAVSFPLTYVHRDIAAVFRLHEHGTDPAVLTKRVAGTAAIMLRILYGNMNGPWRMVYGSRTLITTVLLAIMHNRLLRADNTYRAMRDGAMRYFYNQSSVAFTLLTFSAVVGEFWKERDFRGAFMHPRMRDARHPGFDLEEDDWYYCWKIVGSLLGLSSDFLPNNAGEATSLFETFMESEEVFPDESHVQELVDAYENIGMPSPKSWVPAIIWDNLKGKARRALDELSDVYAFPIDE